MMIRESRCLCSIVTAFIALAGAGCVSERMVAVQPPETIVDPSVVSTPIGAVQLYNNALSTWAIGVGGSLQTAGIQSLVYVSGMWTDELMHVDNAFFGQ